MVLLCCVHSIEPVDEFMLFCLNLEGFLSSYEGAVGFARSCLARM